MLGRTTDEDEGQYHVSINTATQVVCLIAIVTVHMTGLLNVCNNAAGFALHCGSFVDVDYIAPD